MGKILPCRNISFAVHFVLCLTIALGVMVPMAAAQSNDQPQSFGGNVKEVLFPFDIYNRAVNPEILDPNAAYLKQNPDSKMWIQGYADPRGDIVYNLVLSYHRAQWTKAQLVKRGVDGSRVEYATGWGKLYQTCERTDEKCFQENRRVDVVTPDSMMSHWAQ